MSQPKKKSFIRFEAIIPTAIIFALITAYSMLFLDTNLRQASE